jgi:hypothetical protein
MSEDVPNSEIILDQPEDGRTRMQVHASARHKLQALP